MADIFISYKKEDAGRVIRIVEGLRAEGFSVWWDHGITPGSSWDQMIQTELSAAKIVVAVWSKMSVSAPWVKEEAMTGKHRGTLVPVRIDDINPPLGFCLIQFADLIDWDGDIEDKHWDFFIESVRATMDGRPVEGLEKPAPKKKNLLPILAAVAVLIGIIGSAGVFAFNSLTMASVERNPDGSTTVSYSREGPAPPGEAEQALFDTAQETALKEDYQDYLRSFPQGYYARQIREEILPLCKPEQRDIWRRQQAGQMLVGVSDTSDAAGNTVTFQDEVKACASAKQNVENDANRYCRGFAAGTDARNAQTAMEWIDCECTTIEATGDVWCKVEPTYSCVWEVKSFEFVEVCA